MRFANAISSIYIFIFPSKFDLSHGRAFAMGHEISLCSHNPFRPSLRTIGKCNTLASRYIALGLRYVCPIKREAPWRGPGKRNDVAEAEQSGDGKWKEAIQTFQYRAKTRARRTVTSIEDIIKSG